MRPAKSRPTSPLLGHPLLPSFLPPFPLPSQPSPACRISALSWAFYLVYLHTKTKTRRLRGPEDCSTIFQEDALAISDDLALTLLRRYPAAPPESFICFPASGRTHSLLSSGLISNSISPSLPSSSSAQRSTPVAIPPCHIRRHIWNPPRPCPTNPYRRCHTFSLLTAAAAPPSVVLPPFISTLLALTGIRSFCLSTLTRKHPPPMRRRRCSDTQTPRRPADRSCRRPRAV